MSKPAFELYDALGEFFLIQTRSATLDGSIPLRAAQHCTPFTEGNSAGLQLIPPFLHLEIHKNRKFEISTPHPPEPEIYEETVDWLRHNEVLSAYWCDILEQNGPVWDQGDKAYIWTGYVIRPAANTWILNGGAYNRRAQVKTIDLVYADSKNFQPLFCAIDVSEMKPGSYDIAAELGCLLGLQPGAEVKVAPIEESSAEIKAVCDFFDDQYYEEKKTKPATGKYRALKSLKNKPAQSSKRSTPEVTLVEMLNCQYQIDTFKNFVGSSGIALDRKINEDFKFIILKSSFTAKLDWDGTFWKTQVAEDPLTPDLVEAWTKVGGDAGERFANTVAQFVWLPAPTESLFNVAPWALLKTSPGWSSIYDGVHFENAEGLRGVVRTDQLHQVTGVYRLINGPRLLIKEGSDLMRILPIPRHLLNPEYKVMNPDELTR
jgi:hypothetical protein